MIKSGNFEVKEENLNKVIIEYYPTQPEQKPDKSPTPGRCLDVPYSAQWESDAMNFRRDCGAACVEMVGEYYRGQLQGVGTNEIMHYITGGKDENTGYDDLKGGLLHFYNVDLIYRRSAAHTLDLLRSHVDADTPTIVLVRYGHIHLRMDLSYVGGHWMVVCGYDQFQWAKDTVQRIIVHDPDWMRNDMAQGGYLPITENMFTRAWEYYTNIVLIPKPL